MVLENLKPVWDMEIRQTKLRIGYRIMGRCEEFAFSPEYPIHNLQRVRQWKYKQGTRRLFEWIVMVRKQRM